MSRGGRSATAGAVRALGLCANGVRTLEAAAFRRIFGVRHLESIRGAVHAAAVGVSSFGQLTLAEGRAMSDTYRPVVIVLTLVIEATVTGRGLGLEGDPTPSRHARGGDPTLTCVRGSRDLARGGLT